MGQTSEAADKFMASVRDSAEVLPFNNDKAFGLLIRWGLAGVGFGELTFAVDKETGEAHVDTEHVGNEACGKIMDLLRESGKIVKEAEFVKVGPTLSLPTTAVNWCKPDESAGEDPAK